jgi:hypothetical protein
MTPAWVSDWTWGLLLIAMTLVLHAVGLVLIILALSKPMALIRSRRGKLSSITGAALLIGAAGWMLAVLHGLEAVVWAAAYALLGAIDSPRDAILYSLDSMTTRGSPGMTLQPQWQLMGALESADGMLLFGISTAFLFAVLERVWSLVRPEGPGKLGE